MQAKNKSVKLDLDYSIIFNAASNGMAFTEYESGKIVDVNAAWIQATGIDRKKSVGKTANELGLWASQAERNACLTKFKQEGRLVEFEARLVMRSVELTYLISAQLIDMQGSQYALWEFQDITERKRHEIELSESKNLLQTIIDNSPMRVFWKDTDLRYLGCNPAFARDAGKTEPSDLIGKDDYQMAWVDQADLYRGDDRQVIDSGIGRLGYEEPQTTPDGRKIWLRTSKVKLSNTAGETIGVLGIYDDITERKHTELALLTESEKNKALLRNASDGIHILDMNGNVIEASDSFCKMLGYTRDEIIGMNVSRWDAQWTEAELAEIVKQHHTARIRTQFETRHRRKDGSIFVAEVSSLPLELDGKPMMFYSSRDITERRIAGDALRESEQWLRTIIETEPECLKVVGRNGSIINMNSAGLAMLEADSMEEIQRHPLVEFLLPEYRASFMALHSLVMGGESGTLEFEITGLKGTRRWLETHAAPLRDASGKITSLLGVTRDITVRKRLQEEQSQSNQRFRTLFESSPDPVWIIDGHRFVDCNQAAVDMLRYPDKQSLLNIHPSELSPDTQPDGEDSFGKAERMMNIAQAEGLHRFEWVHKRADGSNFFAEVTLSTITLQERPVIYCVWRDISERKQAEEELKKSERRSQIAAESAQMLIWELDLAMDELRYDDAAIRLLDISTHNPPHRIQDWLSFVHPDDRAKFMTRFQDTLQPGNPLFDLEYRYARQDGQWGWAHTRGQIIQRDLNGNPRLAVGSTMNITTRKQLEQILAENEQRMELALAGADLGMWDLDISCGRYTHNVRFIAMLGYEQAELETAIEKFESLINPDDKSLVNASYLAHLKGETQFLEAEYRMRHKDGHWVWVLTRGKVVERDENYRALRMTGTNLDITDRKRAEIKMQQSEALLRITLESADEGMLMTAHDGRVLSFNPRFIELWKVPQALTDTGKDDLLMTHALDQLAEPDVFLNRLRQLDNNDDEARDILHFKDGRVFARYTRSLSIGGARGRIWCFKDITEQTRAQAALAEREEIFRSIVTQANDGILLIDAETLGFVEFNDAACRNLGYNREEFAKLSIVDIQGTMNAAQTMARVRAVQAAGQMEFDNLQRRKDGSLCPVRVSSRSINLQGHPYIASIVADITQRKSIEDELRQTKERYDFATMIGHVGTWDWSPGTGVLVWSDETYRLMGYVPGSITPSYELYLGLVHPDDREMLNSGVQAALNEKKPYSLDCRIVLGSGKEIACHVTGNVEFDADGKPIRMLGTIQDITERKRIELALQRKTEKNLALLRNASDGIHILDTDGNVIEASDSFCQMLGYTLEETIGMNVAQWDVQFSEAELRKVVAGQFANKERVQFESRHRRKDGSIFDVEVSGFPLVLEGKPVLFNSSRDISERKRMHAQLLDAESSFRQLVDQSPLAIQVIATDGKTLSVNKAWEQFWGVPLEALANYNLLQDRQLIDKGVMPAIRKAFDVGSSSEIIVDYDRAGTPEVAGAKDGKFIIKSTIFPTIDSAGTISKVVLFQEDITARKHAEEALKESEERYRGIFDESIAVIYVFDNDKHFTNTNQAGLDLLGYSREELLSMSIPDVDADPVAVEPAHQELDSGGRLVNFEHRLRRKDGTVITVLNNSRPLTDLQGNVVGILSTLIDITERKKVEDQLRKLAQAVEQSPESIVITNLEAKIEYVNAAFVLNTGYSREEVMGQNPRLLQSGKTPRENYDSLWHAISNGHLWKGEFYNRRKDGSEFIEFAIITPIHQLDGHITHYVAVKEDITEKKHISEELDLHRNHLELLVEERTAALAARERHLNVILSGIPGVVGYWDKEQINRFANTAYHDWLGLTPEEIQGKTMREVFGEHIYELNRPLVEAALRGESQVFERAYPHQGRPGEFRFARVHYVPDREGDDVVGFFVMAFDIDELKRARETAEAASIAKSAFLANMSHEIRTPLNAVLGMAKIGLRDNQNETTRKQLQHILSSGHHLLGVINDILDYSKIEADKMVVESHRFRLATVVEEIVNLMSVQAREKNLSLSVLFAPDLPDWVMSDSLRLRQILANLFSNAIKFTDHGSIVLSVMKQDKDILFQLVDSGIGMTNAQLGLLFQPFQQGDSSTTRRFGGTGLGLAISRKLAHLMGGEISVKSAIGEGSTFTLRLPLQVAEPGLAEQAGGIPAFADHLRLKELRVLAAEDVDVNRIILEDLLAHEGAQIVFAENGQQAIDMIEEAGIDAFDVVLMDVQMPVMDGYESTRRICELAPDLPVIGLTAHALEEERERCLACGMMDHVTKPIDTELLIGTILKYTGRSDLSADRSLPFGTVYMKPAKRGETHASKSMIDWATLNSRFKNRSAFIRKLAQTALDTHTGSPDKLRNLAEEADYQGLAFLAHNLKGLAGNLAADAVQALASSTEKEAKNQEASALDHARQLADQLATTINELHDFIRSNP